MVNKKFGFHSFVSLNQGFQGVYALTIRIEDYENNFYIIG